LFIRSAFSRNFTRGMLYVCTKYISVFHTVHGMAHLLAWDGARQCELRQLESAQPLSEELVMYWNFLVALQVRTCFTCTFICRLQSGFVKRQVENRSACTFCSEDQTCCQALSCEPCSHFAGLCCSVLLGLLLTNSEPGDSLILYLQTALHVHWSALCVVQDVDLVPQQLLITSLVTIGAHA
jgi:hypothetical protein